MLHCPICGRDYAAEITVCPADGAALQADPTLAAGRVSSDPLLGHVLDEKYRLDERLGEGGMGTVYRATHLLIDRPVAVKVLNPRLVTDEAARERLRREARAAGRLQHSNAVAVTDFGQTTDGLVYIVMELLEGTSLRDVLAREAPLDPARAVSLMLQTAAAVAAAHEAGVIHRDLKPGNIFIVQRPNAPYIVKVLDFGIAKLAADATGAKEVKPLTQAGAMIGTPRYMSPEQCDGGPLTPASDVYSLGVILYEMLTGQTPFTGATPLALALKHASEEPRAPREIVPTIPPALEEVVLHALEKDPEKRPPDAGAFRRELYATAERLGLEHAGGFSAPTLEVLREAGTETPSGRLVIDIERLRQQRAAGYITSDSDPHTAEEGQAVQTAGRDAPRAAPIQRRIGLYGVPRGKPLLYTQLRRPSIIIATALVALVVSAGIVLLVASRSTKQSSVSTAPASDSNEAVGRTLSAAGAPPPRTAPASEPQTSAEFFERGQYYYSVRDYDEAIRDLRRALDLQKDFPAAHNRLGLALLMKSQFAAAAREFRAAVEQKNGDYPAAQYNLGFALQQQGNTENISSAYQDAINAYQQAIKNRGGTYPDAYYQTGICLLALKRYAEAADAFRKTLEQDQGPDPDAHNALGSALATEQKYPEAEAEFRSAIEQSNNLLPEAHYNLAGVLYEMNERPAEAIKEYETYLQQRPAAANRQFVESRLRDLRRRLAGKGNST